MNDSLNCDARIAYFSMEIALAPNLPTYSGGLGVLAGDTVRTAADLGIPMVAVCLLHRLGYFRQTIDGDGHQHEIPDPWDVDSHLQRLPARVSVPLESRIVEIAASILQVHGVGGHRVPVIFLDTDLPANDAADRRLTDRLYGGDEVYRLSQEIILGIGGVRMLRALGFDRVQRFHMNEGHAALLTIELLDEAAQSNGRNTIGTREIDAVRSQCVFTTHTPVQAGHDRFPLELVYRLMGQRRHLLDTKDVLAVETYQRVLRIEGVFTSPAEVASQGAVLNMTYLALNFSRYVNGVARKHGELSELMFSGYRVDAITNGVHAATWVCPPMAALFDEYIPGWQRDNFSLRYALAIPTGRIVQTHRKAKSMLLDEIETRTDTRLDPDVLTIGFARRMTSYKRPDLLFSDLQRLRTIAQSHGQIQVVFAGKAHPQDGQGKALIHAVHAAARALGDDLPIVFVPDYDVTLAKLFVSGCDLWLNTPRPPNEASGTSGMKAAMNGVPSLSTLDGWWIEGHLEEVTGWAIATPHADGNDDGPEAENLYDKLENCVIPCFYRDPDRFALMMRHCIALNGAFFNSQRMLHEYVSKAYA